MEKPEQHAVDKNDLPRHQLNRPARLSMELVDSPTNEPLPVTGSMKGNSDETNPSTSPMGTIRVMSERLGNSIYGKKERKKKAGSAFSSSLKVITGPFISSTTKTKANVSSPLSREMSPPPHTPKKDGAVECEGSNVTPGEVDNSRDTSVSPSLHDKLHSLGPGELEDLPLDSSKGVFESCAPSYFETDDDEERKDEPCFSPKVGSYKSAGAGPGGSLLRPLSPIVLPVLRSPRVRRIFGPEKTDRVATLFDSSSTTEPQHPFASSSVPSSFPSAATLSTEAPTRTLGSAHVASSSALPPKQPPATFSRVTPMPCRDEATAPPLPHPNSSASSAHTQPRLPPSLLASAAATNPTTSQPRRPSLYYVGGHNNTVLQQNFTVALGLCLLACGLSQAGLEWYTMVLGSDYTTWWAGLLCAGLGLATMVSQRRRTIVSGDHDNGDRAASVQALKRLVMRGLYALLLGGGAGAVVTALFFDLDFLDRLEHLDMCGASSDKLVLDNGLVLGDTLGNACAFSSGCACVQFTHPLPEGEVACLNFPRSASSSCAKAPFLIASIVRVSVWLMGGILFFMTILLLRGRAAVCSAYGERANQAEGAKGGISKDSERVVSSFGSSKVRSMSAANRRGSLSQEQPPPQGQVEGRQSWWQTGDEDSSSDEEGEEEVVMVVQREKGKVGVALKPEMEPPRDGGRSHLLTPIPECHTPMPEEEADGNGTRSRRSDADDSNRVVRSPPQEVEYI